MRINRGDVTSTQALFTGSSYSLSYKIRAETAGPITAMAMIPLFGLSLVVFHLLVTTQSTSDSGQNEGLVVCQEHMEKGYRAYLYTAVMIGARRPSFANYNCSEETIACDSVPLHHLITRIHDARYEYIFHIGRKWSYLSEHYSFLREAGIELGKKMHDLELWRMDESRMVKGKLESIGCCYNWKQKETGCVLRFNGSYVSHA
ncbi:hypothetical protein ANCCAN_18147 [Ancylostoma caninum]|uniref:Uncharacterized protein n=1 Tax=Ancylostoma caninum TaxID=29170 RepID=A0A368FV63_ANCCA|nr:hypothetical protein ANCCAN_18147 [Ancylostoma caninum]